jgi:hypothetical protein
MMQKKAVFYEQGSGIHKHPEFLHERGICFLLPFVIAGLLVIAGLTRNPLNIVKHFV